MSLTIVVYGSPAPQGSKKFLGTFKGKDGRTHAKLAESSAKVRPWRQDVKTAAELARNGADPIDGPVALHITFTLPKPKSAPKNRRTWPDKKPDLSKLVRSTEDALVDAGVLRDDSRIVSLFAHKTFPGVGNDSLEAPGARILIVRVDQ